MKKRPMLKVAKDPSFPIVAIGASAGGIQAVSDLLQNLPVDTGMAYIYIQHLPPDQQSFLASILSKRTKMKVQEAKNMLSVEPNKLYVCTPNKEMVLTEGKIKLIPRHAEKSPYYPIDNFFISLAEKYKESVIGIILSGYLTDGTLGLKAIKSAGGLTFAQDNSAQATGMPKSAIAAGVVDFVLSPKEIARKLIRLSKKGLHRF